MASAMEALLELRERQLVEPALEEIATTVAAYLPELPLAARAPMLARLWPLIAQLPSATERMTAFALAWQVRGRGARGWSDSAPAFQGLFAVVIRPQRVLW